MLESLHPEYFLVANAVKAISNSKSLSEAYARIVAGISQNNHFHTGDGCGHIIGVVTGIRSA